MRRTVRAGLLAACMTLSTTAAAEEAQPAQGVIQLDETVISGNQELPKVLYILPWREPGGLPDIELKAELDELEVFRRLYPPAYRRELSYFRTLETTDSKESKE
ncbi:MAG: hypothetical protein PVJ51_14550 [Acidobacteriota bacterium]